MEVVLDRDAFLKGLQMVQNIVEPRQTLPILANVLLEAEGESVRLTATDLEVGARVSVPAKVGAKGAITVSARKLAEIVKELPAAAVALKVDGQRDGELPVRRRDVPAGRPGAGRLSAGGAGRAAVVGDARGRRSCARCWPRRASRCRTTRRGTR